MTNQELARIRKYATILEGSQGNIRLLTPWEKKDLHQLLAKWLEENYPSLGDKGHA